MVLCLEVEVGGSVVLVSHKHSVVGDWVAASLGGLFPGDVHELRVDSLDGDSSWLRDTNGWNVLLVKDALRVDVRFVHEESTWIRHRDSTEVDTSSSSHAEADPERLLLILVEEWHVDLVNWTSVPWSKDLQSGLDLGVLKRLGVDNAL